MFSGNFTANSQRFSLFIVMLVLTALIFACGTATADRKTSSSPTTSQSAESAPPTASATPDQSLMPGIEATSLSANLNGSGSTLVGPALKIWQQEFGKLVPKVRINYQAGGSGQGRSDLLTWLPGCAWKARMTLTPYSTWWRTAYSAPTYGMR
jgi:ABC-type phosphate transport system substrate-binding protein